MMKWSEFLVRIADIVGIDQENIDVMGMAWGLQGKKDKLPLSNENGYKAMCHLLKSQKNPASQVVVVYHPILRAAIQHASHTRGSGGLGDMELEDNSYWGQKVCDSLSRHK